MKITKRQLRRIIKEYAGPPEDAPYPEDMKRLRELADMVEDAVSTAEKLGPTGDVYMFMTDLENALRDFGINPYSLD
jgi:hypothetical protein